MTTRVFTAQEYDNACAVSQCIEKVKIQGVDEKLESALSSLQLGLGFYQSHNNRWGILLDCNDGFERWLQHIYTSVSRIDDDCKTAVDAETKKAHDLRLRAQAIATAMDALASSSQVVVSGNYFNGGTVDDWFDAGVSGSDPSSWPINKVHDLLEDYKDKTSCVGLVDKESQLVQLYTGLRKAGWDADANLDKLAEMPEPYRSIAIEYATKLSYSKDGDYITVENSISGVKCTCPASNGEYETMLVEVARAAYNCKIPHGSEAAYDGVKIKDAIAADASQTGAQCLSSEALWVNYYRAAALGDQEALGTMQQQYPQAYELMKKLAIFLCPDQDVQNLCNS